MRWLVGLLCVLALGVMPVMGCTNDGGEGSFVVAPDGQVPALWEGGLVRTTVELTDEGSLLVLRAENFYDIYPGPEFDEFWFVLEVAFDKDALAALATEQEHVISGQASWDTLDDGKVDLDDVVFTGDGSHTSAVDRALFVEGRYLSCPHKEVGSQSLRGTLRLDMNTTARLAGTIDLRVEGDVPGHLGECMDSNLYDFYDLTLTFDVHRSP